MIHLNTFFFLSRDATIIVFFGTIIVGGIITVSWLLRIY